MTSNINIQVELGADKMPETIQWSAPDGGVTDLQNAKAILLGLWDGAEKSALRIDLWTSKMMVDEMNDFFYQTFYGMADTYLRATQNQALANELKGSGVTMTALCPGLTRTPFAQRAGLDLSRVFWWIPVSDPHSVTLVGYRAMMRGKATAIPGVLSRLVAFSTRFVPRRVAAAIVRAMQKRVAR